MNSLNYIEQLYDDINHMNRVCWNKSDFFNEVFGNVSYRIVVIVEHLLRKNNAWKWIVGSDKKDSFYIPESKMNLLLNDVDAVEKIITLLNSKGITIKQFICQFELINPDNKEIFDIEILEDSMYLKVSINVKSFPAPSYEWKHDGKIFNPSHIDDTDNNVLCTIIGGPITLEKYELEEKFICFDCKKKQLIINENDLNTIVDKTNITTIDEIGTNYDTDSTNIILEASDKVALIIANRNYQILNLGLRTPLSDAETLAEELQGMNYKTVVLADLNLEEMKSMIIYFTKLLGDNVYAVFYFVGHGFQINGQCFLLPINNDIEYYSPEHCLPMNWILNNFMSCNPGMHVILLDICRYEEPSDPIKFMYKAKEIYNIQKIPVRPNAIYGFATSTGGGAYEVVGENNGIFMKYLKRHISKDIPVISILQKVFRDVQNDPLISNIQVPELTCNLPHPRKLTDPLMINGHTLSYENHNTLWCNIHMFPDPITIKPNNLNVLVTIWVNYCGHFTNKCYINVNVCNDRNIQNNQKFMYIAFLKFNKLLSISKPRKTENEEEGITMSYLVSGLQKIKQNVKCIMILEKYHDDESTNNDTREIFSKEIDLGCILITKIT
ncbi:Mucosa-associated lymphoid tissue lymphoma translocation protein 1 [Strongyloides ratti]|uniref:Mucosa-associated lymphoid tissue lymphoma translocation protein 1 n=1 Tax=Strongyloides ratti TaxID=34506 RepID=A0A090KVA4_STRRB|nr:Mucosa-associated lymphoid tissue lymphoma translocation protein 1 [Strongyloides ratti]CEF59780.1 Mucosa-associated lymphoid tissue lymphoma translocation protein 1 [Strongyloides ratti]